MKSIELKTLDFQVIIINKTSFIPNALLITHSHDDHIKELPMLVNKFNEDNESRRKNLMIFCNMECRDQIIKKFPQLSEKTCNNNGVSFSVVQPDETFSSRSIFSNGNFSRPWR